MLFISICVYDFGLHTIQLLRFTKLSPVCRLTGERQDQTFSPIHLSVFNLIFLLILTNRPGASPGRFTVYDVNQEAALHFSHAYQCFLLNSLLRWR